ncbi:right-handed parallel beta-helix repeat-containing protein [Jannaschia rubra]|uniref:right-handed parallel beta-helix repeat-containing protein n=1 Tax=Jannaschia rubra TaxID=282197 RepID=UPI0031E6BF30
MPKYDNIIENVTYTNTLRLTGSEWDNTLVRNVTIRDVKGNGVLLRDVENVTFENVTIRNVTGDGIKLSSSGSTSNVVISDSHISRTGEDGINAGQRYSRGVDHPGLEIVGNTIEKTGLNGGNDGLRHGLYIQSRDFLIEGNTVTDSTDGNGISVRSSGIVRDNIVDDSLHSGIAYFADHMGRNGTLRIEGNTVTDSGYGRDRTDINLLEIKNQGNAVDAVFIASNDVEKGAAGVKIGKGYGNISVSLDTGGDSGYSGSGQGSEEPPVRLTGGGGQDILRGTSRDESLRGGGDDDVFVFEKNGGNDTVRDFVPGSDHIVVYGFRGIDSVADLVQRVGERGGDTVISLGNGDSLTIADTDISALSTGDFLFY